VARNSERSLGDEDEAGEGARAADIAGEGPDGTTSDEAADTSAEAAGIEVGPTADGDADRSADPDQG